MFGSSRLARRLVRWTLSFISRVRNMTPPRVRAWFGRRFNVDETIMEKDAAFDLIRGSVNLVLAGALIALGTSFKLPLSTTFVTFMVAMGTSLADRAWSRESAVFRITGVISVIGGWFLTAGVAFMGAGLIVLVMHYGGHWVMFALGVLTIVLLIRSNRRFRAKAAEDSGDALFRTILATKDSAQVWHLLVIFITERQRSFLSFAAESYSNVTGAFVKEDVKTLDRTDKALVREKDILKSARRKETLCLRQVSRETAIEKSAWFHLGNNCCMSILYNLRRISEICKEHVDNNFLPLPKQYANDFERVRTEVATLFDDILHMIDGEQTELIPALRKQCERIRDMVSDTYHKLHVQLRDGDSSTIGVLYVYLNTLQETREMVSILRKYLRAYAKLRDTDFSGR